jgi:hypothetical protein
MNTMLNTQSQEYLLYPTIMRSSNARVQTNTPQA